MAFPQAPGEHKQGSMFEVSLLTQAWLHLSLIVGLVQNHPTPEVASFAKVAELNSLAQALTALVGLETIQPEQRSSAVRMIDDYIEGKDSRFPEPLQTWLLALIQERDPDFNGFQYSDINPQPQLRTDHADDGPTIAGR